MKILYLTPFVQHPAMKTSFRHYFFLRELARRHDITLLTPTKSPVPMEVLEELRAQAERVLIFDAVRPPRPDRPDRHPLLGAVHEVGRKAQQFTRHRAVIREMRHTFRRLVREERFDLVIFHGHSIFRVIDGCQGPPVVMDCCDARSARLGGRMRHAALHTRPLHWLRYLHARHVERRMVQASPHVAFISCRDRDVILGPASRAPVIPNAVDLEYWRRSSARPEPATLVLHGGMDYRPNVDAALYLLRSIFPRVSAVRPDVRLLIVGRDPLPELVSAAAAMPGVAVTGAVSDVRPYLERATVYAAPLRFGAGQQNKLLEAMAMGVPVVTTANGAEGLRVAADLPPVVVEDNVDAFVAGILRLLHDAAERERLAAAGRAYIAEYFAVERSMQVLEAMCIAAAGEAAVRSHGSDNRRTGADPAGAAAARSAA
jgi:polysaccharide biosynthesis protein PslH